MSFKLKRININNFTKFGNVEFEFASGINIFIGKNGTGKTHLLKLLYAIGLANKGISSIKEKRIFSVIFGDKIKGIFKISEISHLIRNKEKDSEITINYQLIDNPSDFFIQYVGIKDSIESFQDNSDKQSIAFPENIVYLPTQEIITTYQDYISFKKYETNIDETIFDLADSFNNLIPKEKTDFQKNMLSLIKKHLGGELIKENNEFFIKYPFGKVEATLLAEGIKKLATIYYLIENGTITENSILIWDEPEIYFNPKLITILSKLLNDLANAGLQIFLATHDYLLSHQLSLMNEYKDTIKDKIAPIRFFCLEDTEREGVQVYCGSSLPEIPVNPILEEFVSHYDKESELFQRSIKE